MYNLCVSLLFVLAVPDAGLWGAARVALLPAGSQPPHRRRPQGPQPPQDGPVRALRWVEKTTFTTSATTTATTTTTSSSGNNNT